VQIEAFASEIGAFETLHEIWLDTAAACEQDERRVAMWHRAAACARDRMADAARAEKVYRWILDVVPEDRDALKALDALYESQARWADLLDILEQEARVAEFDDEKIAYFLRIGALQRDRLDNLDGAVKAYRSALKLDETNREALVALVDLLQTRAEWPELFRVLETLSYLVEDASERAAIQRRMARIAEEELKDVDRAAAIWDEVSHVESADPTPLRELQRIARARGQFEAYLDACEREIALVAEDPARRVELLREVAIV